MSIPYVDLQINGCFGIDFNSPGLTVDAWQTLTRKLYQSGTRSFLATIITDSLPAMAERIRAVRRCMEATLTHDAEHARCLGIHLEGPFLSSELGYIGAHPAMHACDATVSAAKVLLEAGIGNVKLVTLAPERDRSGAVTDFLSQHGVIVAAGHTNASRDQLWNSIDHGLRMITHFGNACPAVLPRHDNIMWRIMSIQHDLYVGLIADSHHLPLWMLPVLTQHFGQQRIVCVSDAISAAGLGQGTFQLGERRIVIDEELVARDAVHQHFVGSTSLLDRCEQHLRSLDFFSDETLRRLLHDNALDVLSLADSHQQKQ